MQTNLNSTILGARNPKRLVTSLVVAASMATLSAAPAVTWSGTWFPVPDTGTKYHSLSGPFLTDVGCSVASYGDLSHPLFICAKRTSDQTVWLNSTSSDPALQVWDGWREVPGGVHTTYSPSVSYYYGDASLNLDVVMIGTIYGAYNGNSYGMYLNSYNFGTNTWSGWTPIPGIAAAGVSVVNRHIYAKGLNWANQPSPVYENVFDASSNGWKGWKQVPGGLTTKAQICAYETAGSGLSASLWASRSLDGQLYNNTPNPYTPVGWNGWTTLGYQAVTDEKAAGPLPVNFRHPDYLAFIKGVGDHQIYGLKSSGPELIPGNKLTDAGLDSCTVLYF
jgi:hypothetical protein